MAKKKKQIRRKKTKNSNNIFYVNMSVLFGSLLVLLMIILKDNLGIIGQYVANGFFIVFGLTAYIVPILIIYFYFMLRKKMINKSNIKKNICIILIWLNISIILGLIYQTGILFSTRIENSNNLAILSYTGPGMLGASLHFIFQKFINDIGIYIFTAINIFISILVFTNTKLEDFFNLISKWTKSQNSRIKKNRLERKREVREKKLNQIQKSLSNEDLDIDSTPRNHDISNNSETQNSSPVINYFKEEESKVPAADGASLEEDDSGQLNLAKDFDEIDYDYPPIELLVKPNSSFRSDSQETLKTNGQIIVNTLSSFGIDSEVKAINSGPTVTSYEIKPQAGIKVSKIVNLSNDLSLSLATSGIRIEAPIPGKPHVGIEVPNKNKDMVVLRDLLAKSEFEDIDNDLTVALGKNLFGEPIYAKINEMPHVLIAGATGAGKSVCVNTIIMSLLYKYSPEEVEFIMIDPKMVELSIYNGIPHLRGRRVVTDAKRATTALDFAVREMVDRYEKFSKNRCKDIKSYNDNARLEGEKPMPYLVVIIDELSDLMMESSKEVENHITRISQMGRAAGIHLIIATQRPSVDVITGVIKANIPSRISFQVSSQIDSRTILDSAGAEKLLGKGDMLYFPSKFPKPMRLQGAFVSDKEVERVVSYVKNENEVMEDDDFNKALEDNKTNNNEIDDLDDMLNEAIEFVVTENQASISAIQRRFRVGYNRAGRMIDQMESLGIVGKHEGSKPRKILITLEDLHPSSEEEEETDEFIENEFGQ